jgi:membrane protein CcdC involved in cytochrome C biogenesis
VPAEDAVAAVVVPEVVADPNYCNKAVFMPPVQIWTGGFFFVDTAIKFSGPETILMILSLIFSGTMKTGSRLSF